MFVHDTRVSQSAANIVFSAEKKMFITGHFKTSRSFEQRLLEEGIEKERRMKEDRTIGQTTVDRRTIPIYRPRGMDTPGALISP